MIPHTSENTSKHTSSSTDAVFFGEALIDLVRRGEVLSWHPGGAPANAAVAAARCGVRAGLIATVGQDLLGDMVLSALARAGVDCTGVRQDPHLPTSLALAMTHARTTERFVFYRAADVHISEVQARSYTFRPGIWLIFGAVSLCHANTSAVVRSTVGLARGAGSLIFVDANYRSRLWESERHFSEALLSLAGQMDVLKVSRDEAEILSGTRDAPEAAAHLQRCGVPVVIVTLGKDGCLIRTEAGQDFQSAPTVAQDGDAVGTGDAFVGAFVAHLLSSPDRDVRTLAGAELVELNRKAQQGTRRAASSIGAGWDSDT